MQGIREFNKKITSLKNTRKITSSMKMISSVKLQRFSKLRQTTAPFWETAQASLERICCFAGDSHVLCNGYPQGKKTHVLLFSSDRGLCGRFNTNAIRKALQLFDELTEKGNECTFSFAGGKGFAFFKRRKLPVGKVYEGGGTPGYNLASVIADDLFDKYMKGEAQQIWIVYTRKAAGMTEEPCSELLLPFNFSQHSSPGTPNVLLEEDSTELLVKYALMAIRAKIYKAHLESTVSEHAARMSAMDTATTNCDQMIQRYIKLRNRARQTAITTELSEIVSGKEAIDN